VSPVVSPDGSKLAFLESETDFDIISVDLATAVVTSVMATQRAESMPAWAARASTLVYITSRNGAQEIWLRTPGQADRPLVTPRDFPPDTTRGFRAPVLSPDGTRVIYRRSARGGGDYLWISAVAGGPPLGLVKDPTTVDFGGSWSPDGNWFVYSSNVEGSLLLKKLRTAGQSEPEVLKADVRPLGTWVPLWSPSGEWVLYDDGGATLISPDGSTTRRLSTSRAVAYAFSADGQTIYGIRPGASSRDRIDLFSIGVTTGIETTIGSLAREHLPANPHLPTLRLSLTPDGRSITYSVARRTANLWLMDGLASIPLR
ncbi:MAG: hypothetical protein Q8L75_10655, partial [Acidobacteriota bacterium]|nr:hypothetical protein [Acidobacteriota bacterium]